MEIRIVATSFDLLSNEETLIKDGIAYLLDENHLTYLEDGLNSVRNEIVWNDDEIILTRLGPTSSTTSLKLNQYSFCKVDTVYGELILDSYLIRCNKDNDSWSVEYKLYNQGDLIAHNTITWEIKGVSYESN